MNAVLDFPAIQAEPTPEIASEVVDRAQIVGGAPLVKYSRTEAALVELRTRHAGAVFDLTTTKGDQAARAARLELVTLRTSLEKQRKAFKSPALEFGRLIDSEAARITEEIEALEASIDGQIRADEARRAAAKAERERIEAERVAAHRAFIGTLGAYADHCRKPGMTAERIHNGILALTAVIVGPEREEFEEPAKLAKTQALIAMTETHAQAVAREAEAARQEAIRVENARVAAELAVERERIAAAAAALRRQSAELEANQVAAQRAEQEAARQLAEEEARLTNQVDDRIRAGERLSPQHVAELMRPSAMLPEAAPTGKPQAVDGCGGHLAQDLSRGLSQALASKPDAMLHAREAAAVIAYSATEAAIAELQALAAEARTSRFPSHPKMTTEWWARWYAAVDALALK